MAAGSLLALLDDIAAVLDDVTLMTKVAAKKTAGRAGRRPRAQCPAGDRRRLVARTAGGVGVDLRVNSPTFGKWFSIELNSENKTQLYVPVGFAHGFATLSDVSEIQYKQTGYYNPEAEGGIAWNDVDLGIPWPFNDPILSKRDQNQMSLRHYRERPAFT